MKILFLQYEFLFFNDLILQAFLIFYENYLINFSVFNSQLSRCYVTHIDRILSLITIPGTFSEEKYGKSKKHIYF